MAVGDIGLTKTGFIPMSFDEIKTSIEDNLEKYNPGFDLSPESPDGQQVAIMSALLSQAWIELDKVYHSYNPNTATGQALKNLGMITGIYKGVTTRSQAVVSFEGTPKTIVPKGSIVADDDGNQYYTNRDCSLPAEVMVLAVVSGPIPVPAGSITTLVSQVSGWDSVVQTADGIEGSKAETELQYRQRRNKSVMRGSNTVIESMAGSIYDLGIEQVDVVNNDTNVEVDSVPAHNIHVVIGETSGVSDDDIAQAIFDNKGLGVPTYGSTAVSVSDKYHNAYEVSFTKATEVPVFFNINITFHDDDIAGAEEQIQSNITEYINSLLVGEDVIWSRIFCLITPVAKAEVTLLELGDSVGTLTEGNLVISDLQYTSCIDSNIVLNVT